MRIILTVTIKDIYIFLKLLGWYWSIVRSWFFQNMPVSKFWHGISHFVDIYNLEIVYFKRNMIEYPIIELWNTANVFLSQEIKQWSRPIMIMERAISLVLAKEAPYMFVRTRKTYDPRDNTIFLV